jgi:hypothetical protein
MSYIQIINKMRLNERTDENQLQVSHNGPMTVLH